MSNLNKGAVVESNPALDPQNPASVISLCPAASPHPAATGPVLSLHGTPYITMPLSHLQQAATAGCLSVLQATLLITCSLSVAAHLCL